GCGLHSSVGGAEREFDGPRGGGARARRHPEFRDVREGKTRPPNASVETAPEQYELDPTSKPRRRRQADRAPLRSYVERMRQRQREEVTEHGRQKDADDGEAQRRARVVQRVVGRGVEAA